MADKEGIASGTGQHADHGQPDVRGALRRIFSVSNAEHV